MTNQRYCIKGRAAAPQSLSSHCFTKSILGSNVAFTKPECTSNKRRPRRTPLQTLSCSTSQHLFDAQVCKCPRIVVKFCLSYTLKAQSALLGALCKIFFTLYLQYVCPLCVPGEMVTKQPLIRSMRTVKRETLKLISGWVSRSNDPQMVRSHSEILRNENLKISKVVW